MNQELKNALTCAKSEDFRHIVDDPVTLSCGHFICKECLPFNNMISLVCCKCEKTNEFNLDTLRNAIPVEIAKIVVTNAYSELFLDLYNRYEICYNLFKEMDYVEFLNSRIEFLKEEIDIRIESLKVNLETLRTELFEELDSTRNKWMLKEDENKDILNEHELILKKLSLKANEKTFDDKRLFFNYQNSLKKLENFKGKLTEETLQIKFTPSDEQFEKANVGSISVPDSENLKTVTGSERLQTMSSSFLPSRKKNFRY